MFGSARRLRGRVIEVGFAILAVSVLAAGCGDDGAKWQVVTEGLDEALLAVSGTSATDVYAVGADKGAGPIVLHYDGASWTRLETGRRGDLWWVHAFPEGPVLMGGASGAILRYEAGAFTRVPTPGFGSQVVYGVWGTSPDDVYAVGTTAGRNGFVWHYDGASFSEMPLPADLPLDASSDIPGFFKVWGDAAGHVYVVGGSGVVLRSTGGAPFEVVATGGDRLFTVHGSGETVVAVGGAAEGVLLEATTPEGDFIDVTPAGVPLVQGVCLDADGEGYAAGFAGTMLRRADGAWASVDHGLALDVESLHAVWMDPEGGVWAVGGNVLSTRLDAGALVHFGGRVADYDAPAPDGGVPAATCPEAQIDPAPDGSIARRWDEQILGAIRRAVPRPGVHARNLYHVSAAMYDAWAAYDATADGVFSTEKPAAADPVAARATAISYAAYRVLVHRYASEAGGGVSLACFRAFMGELDLDPDDTTMDGDEPVAVGNRIGAAVIAAGADDGANEANDYADTTGWTPTNAPLVVDSPIIVLEDPAHWQQLVLAQAVTQNGIPQDAGAQGYVGAQWGEVTPFAMTRPAPGEPYFDVGPGPAFDDALVPAVVEVIQKSSWLDATDGATIDISPGAYGNNPLASNAGTGHATNPATGAPYAPNVVPRGDFGRVLAEFWADGPTSETPPGHWNVLANQVADHPTFERRFHGTGALVDPLAWDVVVYLALNGAVHDAAIAAWEQKRVYASSRPISLIRYMASLGQRTDPGGPSYDPNGLPLVDGLIEVITAESSAPGERHAHLARYVGEIALLAWRGEPGDRETQVGGVGFIRGVDWQPYQRRTFVTPAFPGFISGHSTFSRAAAEVLVALTGSEFFPGGLGSYQTTADAYLFFERGPTVPVRLEWATYYDAADQAGQSRIYGGIHIEPDDFEGRTVGAAVGMAAVTRAEAYLAGSAVP